MPEVIVISDSQIRSLAHLVSWTPLQIRRRLPRADIKDINKWFEEVTEGTGWFVPSGALATPGAIGEENWGEAFVVLHVGLNDIGQGND